MNGDGEKNEAEFIPDFYREFISRIIPGLVVIALYLYWSNTDFKAIFPGESTGATITSSSFLFIAAWIIGVTLDVGIFLIAVQILRIIQKKFHCLKHCLKKLLESPMDYNEQEGNNEQDEWEYLRAANPWERGIIIKTFAQVIFFRGMFSICALTVILSVSSMIGRPEKLSDWLPVLFRMKCTCLILSLVFSLLFCLCWWQGRKGLFEHLNKLSKRQAKAEKDKQRR